MSWKRNNAENIAVARAILMRAQIYGFLVVIRLNWSNLKRP